MSLTFVCELEDGNRIPALEAPEGLQVKIMRPSALPSQIPADHLPSCAGFSSIYTTDGHDKTLTAKL